MKSRSTYLLCIDPGFASLGLVVLRLRDDKARVVRVQLVTTVKSPKKQRILASHENVQRGREIATELQKIGASYGFAVFANCANNPAR